MNSALFQSLFCYPRCQSQDQEEEEEENDQEEKEEEKEKDQEEERRRRRRMTRRRRRRRRRRTRRRRRRRRTRRRRWWCWRSSCFRHLSFQMEMSTRHAFLYGVVCVWIWHVIGQLCFDPSTRFSRSLNGHRPPRALARLGGASTTRMRLL